MQSWYDCSLKQCTFFLYIQDSAREWLWPNTKRIVSCAGKVVEAIHVCTEEFQKFAMPSVTFVES
jgi:hypothetical protein